MVDTGGKEVTARFARAEARVIFPQALGAALVNGELHTKKGPVFQTAILAGIQAAKRTYELIPLCHLIPLEKCHIGIASLEDGVVQVICEVKATHKTGVEMEALTGASIAALTIYDMCKALSHGIRIEQVRLLEKTGGKRDYREEVK